MSTLNTTNTVDNLLLIQPNSNLISNYSVDSGDYDPSDVEIDISLKRHKFGFGTAIVADRVSGTSDQDRRYQEVLYDNFEWAVFENAMKWRQMEWDQVCLQMQYSLQTTNNMIAVISNTIICLVMSS